MEKVESENTIESGDRSIIRPRSCPGLLIYDKGKQMKQIFYNVSKNRYRFKPVSDDMCNTKICYSSGYDEWMLLKNLDSEDLYIYNIVTMDKIGLPSTQSIPYTGCILTLPPTNPRSHVLLWRCNEPSKIWFCQPGDAEYITQDIQDLEFLAAILSKVEENKIYFVRVGSGVNVDDKLIIVEFIGPKVMRSTHIILKKYIDPSPVSMPWLQFYLIEDDEGELFHVVKNYLGPSRKEVDSFYVYKLDFSNKEWVQVKSIGEKSIFLPYNENLNGGFLTTTSGSGVKQNAIYHTQNEDRLMHIYNLENRTVSMFLPCSIVTCFPNDIVWLNYDIVDI